MNISQGYGLLILGIFEYRLPLRYVFGRIKNIITMLSVYSKVVSFEKDKKCVNGYYATD